MSFNLISKRCQICGKHVSGGTKEATENRFDGMRLTRPVWGLAEFIWVCTYISQADGKYDRSDCFKAAAKLGYVVDHGRAVTR